MIDQCYCAKVKRKGILHHLECMCNAEMVIILMTYS